MIVKTRNSEYLVEELPGPGFRITKTNDLRGYHGSVEIGDIFEGDEITVKVGEKLLLKKNFVVVKSPYFTTKTLPNFWSTPVIEIKY